MAREVLTYLLDVKGGGAAKRSLEGVATSADKAKVQTGGLTAKLGVLKGGLLAAGPVAAVVSAALLGVAGAAAGAAKGYADLANEVNGTVDTLGTFSAATGLSMDTLAGLRAAAGATNKDLSELVPTKLAKNILEVSMGIGRAKDAFEILGVEATTATGELRDADGVFFELIDKLSGVESATERAALAEKALGTEGRNMFSAFSDVSDLQRFVDLAREFGTDHGPEAVARTQEWFKATGELKTAWDGVRSAIVEQTTPAALESIGLLTEATIALGVALEQPGAVFRGMFSNSDIRQIDVVREAIERFQELSSGGFSVVPQGGGDPLSGFVAPSPFTTPLFPERPADKPPSKGGKKDENTFDLPAFLQRARNLQVVEQHRDQQRDENRKARAEAQAQSDKETREAEEQSRRLEEKLERQTRELKEAQAQAGADVFAAFASGDLGGLTSAAASLAGVGGPIASAVVTAIGLVGGQEGPQVANVALGLLEQFTQVVANIPKVISNLLDPEFLSGLFGNLVENLTRLFFTLPLELVAAFLRALPGLFTELPGLLLDAFKKAVGSVADPFKNKNDKVLGLDFTTGFLGINLTAAAAESEDGRRFLGAKLPSFAEGADRISRGGLARLHRGEEVRTARDVGRGRSREAGLVIQHMTVLAPDPKQLFDKLRGLQGSFGAGFSLDPFEAP